MGLIRDAPVVVNIEHTAKTVLRSQQDQKYVVFSGKAQNAEVSSVASPYLGSTDDALLGIMELLEDHSEISQTTTMFSKLCTVPDSMSPPEACSYTAALLLAIAKVQKELGVTLTSSHQRPDRRTADSPSGRRIVIVGGETHLGAALTQILVRVRPDAKVVLLSSMSDQRELFQRTSHLVGLGAWYAIDGAIPDLMEHAGLAIADGVECILNATDDDNVRGDVSKVGRVVDCNEHSRDAVSAILDVEQADLTVGVFAMLREAADMFDTYTAPPESCEFADG